MLRLLWVVLMVGLTSCTAVGDWLSGSVRDRHPTILYPNKLESVRIGATTKEEIRSLFGNPTDLQVSLENGTARESWAYADTKASLNPVQYIPGLGVLALLKEPDPSSFSISFSSDGVVDGIVVREVQPFGDPGALRIQTGPGAKVASYGTYNPLVRQSRDYGSFHSNTSSE